MFYVIELQNRPDGITNSTLTARSSLALGLQLYYQRAASAVVSGEFTSVALTLISNTGEVKKNELFETLYVPAEETNE